MKPKYFAHRANGFGFLENSKKSISAALKSRADGIELDLRLTKDKQYIVMHDAYLDRLTKSKGLIRNTTSLELKKTKLVDGQNITFLTDVLPILAKNKKKQIILELKEHGREKKLLELLMQFGLLKNTYLAAWNPLALDKIKKINAETKTMLNYFPIPRFLRWVRIKKHQAFKGDNVLVTMNKQSMLKVNDRALCLNSSIPKGSFDAIGCPALAIRPHLAEACKKRSIKLVGFAVDSHSTYKRMKDLGAEGVITDRFLSLHSTKRG